MLIPLRTNLFVLFITVSVISNGCNSNMNGKIIEYKSFYGDEYFLCQWKGKRVVILAQNYNLRAAVMDSILTVLDTGYDYYREITGKDPKFVFNENYTSLLPIAIVNNTCGFGCGTIGVKGIEIQADYFSEIYDTFCKKKLLDQLFFYEFGRNFWFYDRTLTYNQSITLNKNIRTGFAVFMRFKALDALNIKVAKVNGDDYKVLRNAVEQFIYECERDRKCSIVNVLSNSNFRMSSGVRLNGADLWASILFYLYEVGGGEEFLMKFWKEIEKMPSVESETDIFRNFFLASCNAIGEDLKYIFRGMELA